ncbi:MAG: glycosyltransferase, partial [Terracidiphilus sp.]
MKKNEKLAILIPTRDEAANILALLSRIQATLDAAEIRYEIIVVDDESRDGTAERVSAAAKADGRIRLLVRGGERGLAGAILHGRQHTDAEILGVIDADLQHPPELLPALFNAIVEGRDLAVGSRYIEGGELDGLTPARRLVSSIAAWASLPLQQRVLRVRDPLSGFFLVRRRCLDWVEFHKSGFKLLLEILVRGRICSVQEIPFT